MIALVDCNNFFASCERLFRPDLAGKPVMVLSNNDGCVVARSQEVKDLGVPMAVPYFQVKDIVTENNVNCFSSNFALYSNISQRILTLLSTMAPHIEVYSIDEAFLDLSELPKQNLEQYGDKITAQVKQQIGMPVSVGIGSTKTLAKLAEVYAKRHRKTCVLDPETNPQEYQEILSSIPVGDIWGIGRRLASKLESFGIKNAKHFTEVSYNWLREQLGINGVRIKRELLGEMVYGLETVKAPQKSLLVSRSFGHSVSRLHELETVIGNFASRAAYQLRLHNQAAVNIGVYAYFRLPDGQHKSASARLTLPVSSSDTSVLVKAALENLYKIYDSLHGYKKLGIFSDHLTSANICQLNILEPPNPGQDSKRQRLMTAVDEVNNRFGASSLRVATIDVRATRWKSLKKRMSPAYTTDWSQLPKVYPAKIA